MTWLLYVLIGAGVFAVGGWLCYVWNEWHNGPTGDDRFSDWDGDALCLTI